MQILKPRSLVAFLGPFFSSYGNACFHSTPSSFVKWKSKREEDRGRGQEPSKSYVRYATHTNRTNAKKALRDVLSKTTYKVSFQDDNVSWSADGWEQVEKKNSNGTDGGMPFNGKYSPDNSKNRNSSQGSSGHQNRNKRRPRKRRSSSDYLEQEETIFQATFGTKCYTWSFQSWGGHQCQNTTRGFEWRDNFNWGTNRTIDDSEADEEDDYETNSIGSSSDRRMLGLPSTGPLKMENVKSAFRTSALKWHPDKHQGSSQAIAEEKFKLCVSAYKSLCSALSSG